MSLGKVFPRTRYSVLFNAGDFHAPRASRITCDALIQRLGDLFAVSVAAQLLLVGRTADEGNFRQDSWHRSFGEYDVGSRLHTAVAQSGILRRKRPIKRALHAGRQPPRLLNFF